MVLNLPQEINDFAIRQEMDTSSWQEASVLISFLEGSFFWHHVRVHAHSVIHHPIMGLHIILLARNKSVF